MKNLFVVLLFTLYSTLFVQANNLDQIREDYIACITDSDKADKLCDQLAEVKNPSAVIMAYLGSVQAIKAKHAWNPVSKMSYLSKGFDTINKAVAKDPNQLEVRFLRFSLQYYVPSFLGYSNNLMTDKNIIVSILKNSHVSKLNINEDILKNMVNFMIDSKKCSPQEIAVLKKVLV
ncbi:hypothetical protein A5893_02875 [Pedobacter psychrophilus]|uniref:Uncharacterized protein n=1 Tax=Pedobacter psychrophilus TaxID=1826909 RepID=A0A179DMD7_9SPHI|nr:hypothetical protein [Pedobacter psychrophilus]OAQ42074.1 hypothetical protein A5893_02875 [Pedobacter psychrophilus]